MAKDAVFCTDYLIGLSDIDERLQFAWSDSTNVDYENWDTSNKIILELEIHS
jgi:hypothetical protein